MAGREGDGVRRSGRVTRSSTKRKLEATRSKSKRKFKNGRSASPDLDDILESFAMADDDDEHNTAKVKTEAAEKTDSNEDNNDDNDVSKFLKIEMPDEHVAVKKEEKIVTDDLSLMCLFSCNLCESVMMRRDVQEHYKRNHPGFKRQTSVYRETFHSCKLCQCTMVFNSDNIYQHLRHCHGDLTWKDYKTTYLHNSEHGEKQTSAAAAAVAAVAAELQQQQPDPSLQTSNTTDAATNETIKEEENDEEMFVSDDINKMCVYTCNVCGQTMKHNVQSVHFKRNHPNLAVQTTILRQSFHRCKLCQLAMSFNVQTLSMHLRIYHKETNWKEYKMKYLMNGLGHNLPKKEEEEEEADDDDGTEKVMSDDLSVACTVVCQVCQAKISRQHLNRHFAKLHPGQKRAFEFDRKIYHSCKLCGKMFLFHLENLSSHIRKSHAAVPLKEYKSLFLTDTTRRRYKREAWEKEVEEEVEEGAEDTRVYTSDLSLLSTIACNLCGKEIPKTKNAPKHFKQEHPDDRPQFTPVRTTYHKCKLCNKSVQFSSKNMQTHLRNEHQNSVSWSNYKAEYLTRTRPERPDNQYKNSLPPSETIAPHHEEDGGGYYAFNKMSFRGHGGGDGVAEGIRGDDEVRPDLKENLNRTAAGSFENYAKQERPAEKRDMNLNAPIGPSNGYWEPWMNHQSQQLAKIGRDRYKANGENLPLQSPHRASSGQLNDNHAVIDYRDTNKSSVVAKSLSPERREFMNAAAVFNYSVNKPGDRASVDAADNSIDGGLDFTRNAGINNAHAQMHLSYTDYKTGKRHYEPSDAGARKPGAGVDGSSTRDGFKRDLVYNTGDAVGKHGGGDVDSGGGQPGHHAFNKDAQRDGGGEASRFSHMIDRVGYPFNHAAAGYFGHNFGYPSHHHQQQHHVHETAGYPLQQTTPAVYPHPHQVHNAAAAAVAAATAYPPAVHNPGGQYSPQVHGPLAGIEHLYREAVNRSLELHHQQQHQHQSDAVAARDAAEFRN